MAGVQSSIPLVASAQTPSLAQTPSISSQDSTVPVPRLVHVFFSTGSCKVKLDCKELDEEPIPLAIKSKLKSILAHHLRPINVCRISSLVCYALFSAVFLFVTPIYFGWWDFEQEWITHLHQWLRVVFFSCGTIMQIFLHFYLRSTRRMKRLEDNLNAVCMEPGAAELRLQFCLVPYKSVDHVLNFRFYMQASKSRLHRAYRNKVDLLEFALENKKCREPDELQPAKDCEACLLQDVASCMSSKVKRFAESVQYAKQNAYDFCRTHGDIYTRCELDFNMVFAISMYTFDLGLLGDFNPGDNFYYNFNHMYREDQERFWDSCKGYLFYLLQGLDRLDGYQLPEGSFLYRGVDKESARRVRATLQQGSTIIWAAFSSATKEEDEAASFARSEDGDIDGIIFRIKLLERNSKCRDISLFSMYPDEKEVLLLPNFTTIVEKGPREDEPYVDLVEVSNQTFIDYRDMSRDRFGSSSRSLH